MVVHRDQKRAAIAPLTKGQSWTDFCVQLTLETYPGPVWNKEATQNGFVSLWEAVSRKRGMASPTVALMQHKSTATLQSPIAMIWTLLRRSIRTRTHTEMVISTETDF